MTKAADQTDRLSFLRKWIVFLGGIKPKKSYYVI